MKIFGIVKRQDSVYVYRLGNGAWLKIPKNLPNNPWAEALSKPYCERRLKVLHKHLEASLIYDLTPVSVDRFDQDPYNDYRPIYRYKVMEGDMDHLVG